MLLSRPARLVLGATLGLAGLGLLAGSWCIPFFFESPSILYKFGLQKIFLRSGKIIGLTAIMLIFLQVALASRLRLLDRIYSLPRLYGRHRRHGQLIACLVLLHPLLVIAAEKFTFFPLEKRYWPEFLGAGLMLYVALLAAVASLHTALGLRYHTWSVMHRAAVLPVIPLATTHVLFVSETFKSGPPRLFLLTAAGISLFLLLGIRLKRWLGKPRKFEVMRVSRAGKDAFAVDLTPLNGPFAYAPGQFAFVRPLSAGLAREEHPFTLASPPTRPATLQLVIRALGAWTRRIDRLRPGDTLLVDGPYGLFSHVSLAADIPLVMIAGGIGITPILSMLRYLADTGERRKVLLIWSNRDREHLIFPEELADLERCLQGLKIVYLFTRENNGGRLDREQLESMLASWERESSVFLCGPPGMMKGLYKALRELRFSGKNIYREEFRL